MSASAPNAAWERAPVSDPVPGAMYRRQATWRSCLIATSKRSFHLAFIHGATHLAFIHSAAHLAFIHGAFHLAFIRGAFDLTTRHGALHLPPGCVFRGTTRDGPGGHEQRGDDGRESEERTHR